MASYNKITLVGNAGNDPQIKVVGDNRKVCEISIAVNEPARGSQPEKTEWYRVSLWDRKAEVAATYVRKGSQVLIEGRLSVRTYVDKDGKDRYSLEVQGNELVLLGIKEQSQDGSQAPAQSYQPSSAQASKPEAVSASNTSAPVALTKAADEDDLPF